ncbi:hypothetical protein EJ110_NYTH51428 [Nymphaea thermarum]|nr:hypothetical protein EJ110_NYTH51428 [Nymphaea thermarum]
MLHACSGDQFKFEEVELPLSPESYATRDFSASGISSRTLDWDAKFEDNHVEETLLYYSRQTLPTSSPIYLSRGFTLMTFKVAEPAFLASLVFLGEDAGKVLADCETDALGMKRLESTSLKLLRSKDQRSLINSVLKYIVGANDLIKSHPEFLLKVLQFLRALWRGGTQYVKILEMLKDGWKFMHIAHLITKHFAGEVGCLSLTSVNKIQKIAQKMNHSLGRPNLQSKETMEPVEEHLLFVASVPKAITPSAPKALNINVMS